MKSRAAAAKKKTRPSTKRATGGALRAIDLMSRDPITVSDEMTVGDLCDLFQERNINGAPVVNGKGELVGVVAQDDIIYGAMGHPERIDDPVAAAAAAGIRTGTTEASPPRRRKRGMVAALRERNLEAVPEAPRRPGEKAFWADQRRKDDPMRMPVRAIMTSPAISAEETTPLKDLCHVMWSLRIHRVPILRGGKVTGIVSSMDLCRGILNGLIKV
jgi:CBS domain-containing protein